MKKAIKYIDAHGHINFNDYDADREEVIAKAAEAGVGIVAVGTDIESSKRAIELAETHENMWATVGVHPTEIGSEAIQESEEALRARLARARGIFQQKNIRASETLGSRSSYLQELRRLALDPKVVAIGECGLDYFHSKEADIPAQIEVFERHISLANEAKKPLMLHVRNGLSAGHACRQTCQAGKNNVRNAYADALEILKRSARVPFNFHFFAGTSDDLKNIIKEGGTVSFTGVLTFTHDYDDLVKNAPLDRVMSETDCPYVAPVPYRGKRSEPVHVIEVVKAVARIRGEDEESVRVALIENAKRFFSLPD